MDRATPLQERGGIGNDRLPGGTAILLVQHSNNAGDRNASEKCGGTADMV